MEINTKFNVGDHVLGISYKHQLIDFVVAKIAVSAKADSVEVDYYPSDGSGGICLCPPKHGSDWQGEGGERPSMQTAVCHAAEDG